MSDAPIALWIFLGFVTALLAIHGWIMPITTPCKVFFAIVQPAALWLMIALMVPALS